MQVIYTPRYGINIGVHVFPTRKYRLVYQRLIDLGVIQHADVIEPTMATWDELALVHTADYLRGLRTGTLAQDDTIRLELPFSSEMVEGFRLMVGGTLMAARLACRNRQADSVTIHLGGGLHHAFPDHGEGFCVFNDVAVRGDNESCRTGNSH